MISKIYVGQKIGKWEIIDVGSYKNSRKAWICKCECGSIYNVLQQSLKNGDSTQCKVCKNRQNANKNLQNLVGKNFGEWTVIKYHISKKRHSYWECLCSCGKTRYIKSDSLVSGRSKSCGKCRSYKDIHSRYWDKIKWSAKKRNKEFYIDIKDGWDIFSKQKGLCAISKLPISFKDSTAYLDRIDSKKGYTIDNIQWVHKDINKMKWDLDQSRFIELCKLVAEK